MKLNLRRLRTMIAEELNRAPRRINEADGIEITVEQFLDEVAERMTAALDPKLLSSQAKGDRDPAYQPSGVRIRRGRYNGMSIGDDTACIIVGGTWRTPVIPDAYPDVAALQSAAEKAMQDMKSLYSGVTITSQGGDYPVDEAMFGPAMKVRYYDIRYGGEDSAKPVTGTSDDYSVYVIPTNLDNRLPGM